MSNDNLVTLDKLKAAAALAALKLLLATKPPILRVNIK